jgi:hypothetical protein
MTIGNTCLAGDDFIEQQPSKNVLIFLINSSLTFFDNRASNKKRKSQSNDRESRLSVKICRLVQSLLR